jgi:hypothetical protein
MRQEQSAHHEQQHDGNAKKSAAPIPPVVTIVRHGIFRLT